MKDCLDTKQRAYEVLNVPLDASRAQIDSAYTRMSAIERSRRKELAEAWHHLRKPESRLEVDFWYYHVTGSSVSTEVPAAETTVTLEPAIPPVAITAELTDLAADRFRAEFRPVATRTVALVHARRYDADLMPWIAPVFDK